MPYQNITGGIDGATKTQIIDKITEAQALMPFLVNLTRKEKQKGLKLGKKTEKFLYDIQEIIDNNPTLIPPYIDKAGYESDFEQLLILISIELKLKALHEAVTDTRKALMNECMTPALAIYSTVKDATRANVPGADTIFETLKPYFKRKAKPKK